jgi:hypothetical protein
LHAVQLLHHCYPTPRGLIVNIMGMMTQMLRCMTTVADGKLHCVSTVLTTTKKTGWQVVWMQLTAQHCTRCIHFSSAHAGSKVFMGNAVLGLILRMYMNTLIDCGCEFIAASSYQLRHIANVSGRLPLHLPRSGCTGDSAHCYSSEQPNLAAAVYWFLLCNTEWCVNCDTLASGFSL